MGRDLAEHFPVARDTFAAIDDALEEPLSDMMWNGPEADLLQTRHAQPAILAHSAAVLAVVADRLGSVVAAAGHSLGEYSAYVACGSLSATDAARLVRRRGELMQQAGTERSGTMAAVLGLASAAVEEVCSTASRDGSVVVAANLNAPDQTVISGDPDAVERAGEGCTAAGARRVLPLKVSGAFHSPLMAPAVPGLRAALADQEMGDPGFPVVANATAEPVQDAVRATVLLAEQLTAPVRWVQCVERLAELAGPDARFVELGPGTVLAGLVRRILGDRPVTSLGTVADLEAFLT